ncbi:MAG: hypothetical protein ACXVC6_03845 [Bacteroidia bacterium]
MKRILPALLCVLVSILQAQELIPDENHVLYNLTLKCTEGGFFTNQEVVFENVADRSQIKTKTGMDGKAKALLPINSVFEINISNFSEKRTVTTPNYPRITMNNTMSYSKNDLKFENDFTMSPAQIAAVDKEVAMLPDTTYYTSAKMPAKFSESFMSLDIVIHDLDKKPLIGETVTITGRKNKKSFKATTNTGGAMMLLLPKGDTYDMSFKYDKNYDVQEVKYMQGTAQSHLRLDYIGSKETERRAKEKAKRMKEDAIRREKEKKEFEVYMKKEGLSAMKAREKEMHEYETGKRSFTDNVILKVFERNKHWKDKLIICDLTGSMSPYAAQLELWYKLNYLKEQNLQFVFFNDGDNMPDRNKKIGETGGIYYTTSKGVDSLIYKMVYVQNAGDGGDGPENNMEALIKGTKKAKPFTELVMIADNLAPVKDITLLESFNIPVRIILCGVGNEIEPDYLKIAYKTKGSVHTMEEDILGISKLLDGQEIKIGNGLYRLMKGRFVQIFKS